MDATQSIKYNNSQDSNTPINVATLQVNTKQLQQPKYSLYTLNKHDFFHLKSYSIQGSQQLILNIGGSADSIIDTWFNIKYLQPQHNMNDLQHQFYNTYKNGQQQMLENYQNLQQNKDFKEIISLGTDISQKSLQLIVQGLAQGLKLSGQLIDISKQQIDVDSETKELFEQTKHSFKQAFKHSGKLVQKLSVPLIEKTKDQVKSLESTIENSQQNFSETVENVSNKTQQKSGQIIIDIGKYLVEVGKSISSEDEEEKKQKQRKQ